jgi:hypothetical protein
MHGYASHASGNDARRWLSVNASEESMHLDVAVVLHPGEVVSHRHAATVEEVIRCARFGVSQDMKVVAANPHINDGGLVHTFLIGRTSCSFTEPYGWNVRPVGAGRSGEWGLARRRRLARTGSAGDAVTRPSRARPEAQPEHVVCLCRGVQKQTVTGTPRSIVLSCSDVCRVTNNADNQRVTDTAGLLWQIPRRFEIDADDWDRRHRQIAKQIAPTRLIVPVAQQDRAPVS